MNEPLCAHFSLSIFFVPFDVCQQTATRNRHHLWTTGDTLTSLISLRAIHIRPVSDCDDINQCQVFASSSVFYLCKQIWVNCCALAHTQTNALRMRTNSNMFDTILIWKEFKPPPAIVFVRFTQFVKRSRLEDRFLLFSKLYRRCAQIVVSAFLLYENKGLLIWLVLGHIVDMSGIKEKCI